MKFMLKILYVYRNNSKFNKQKILLGPIVWTYLVFLVRHWELLL